MRRRREPLDLLWREVVVFKTDTTRMRRMIVIAFFQQLAVLSSALMQLHGLLFLFLLYRKRNIDLLATHFARKRNLFVKVQGIEITLCTLAGIMGRADPANAITWKNFSPASRDPGTAILGSRLTGLARLSCNREVDFCCVSQTCRDPGKLTPTRLTGPARLM